MLDELCEVIESFGYPYYRQGSMMQSAKYPKTFITYWNNDSPDHAHYDDEDFGTAWDYSINVYSSDPSIPYSLLDDIRTALVERGWTILSKGFDVDSDEKTHYGRGIQIYKLEIGG